MRERTTWSRQKIAGQLRRVAEDPRAMNQDHIQQQPAADAYVIGDPSTFAEDVSPPGPGWKADLDGEGNTKRDEIGLPQFRGDTFNKSDKSPGVSPSRQASSTEIYRKAELASKVARRMLSKDASEVAVENQALVLMDLPVANLENTLARLAQDQGGDDDGDDDGDDAAQSKQASDDDDGDDGQDKQAGELPKEFLEQQQKMKDKAKDDKGDKGKDKEARARKAQQQDDDGDQGQEKQARSRKAQQDDDGDQDQGQSKQARSRKAQQQDEGADDDQQQSKQARSRKAQQQDDGDGDQDQGKQASARKAQQQADDAGDDQDQGQDKQARRVKAQDQDGDDDGGQQKQAQDQQQDEGEQQVGKEAFKLIKQAASDLLALPTVSRAPVFKAMLPSLAKVAAYGMQQQGQQQQISQDQIMAQVQQMVQQAMQQQQAQQQPAQAQQQLQSQQQIADQALVDQMLQGEPALAEEQIQMDAPDMDLGMGDEDPALQAIFASDAEVQRALEAREIERGVQLTAARTASTRTVGTRPTAGVSALGGVSAGVSSGAEEITKLSNMWSSAPDVSNVFRS